jgi:hypothetical protein
VLSAVFGDQVFIQNNGDLIDNATMFHSWLENIPRPDEGGGWPENALGALRDSINNMHYRDGSQKIYILITDAPSPSYDETPSPIPTLADVAKQVLDSKSVVYIVGPTAESVKNAYGTGNPPFDWLEEYQGEFSIPTLTGGKFYEIGSDFSTLIYDLANQIINIKISNYQVTYNTSNITHDGSDRLVDVKINYRNITGEASGKYKAPADSLADLTISGMNLVPEYSNDQENYKIDVKVSNQGGVSVTNVPALEGTGRWSGPILTLILLTSNGAQDVI